MSFYTNEVLLKFKSALLKIFKVKILSLLFCISFFSLIFVGQGYAQNIKTNSSATAQNNVTNFSQQSGKNSNSVNLKVGKSSITSNVAPSNNLIQSLGVGTADKNFFRFMGDASYTPQIRKDQVGGADFLLRGEYFFSGNQRIRVDQRFTRLDQKLYSAYEFKPWDTSISHFINLPWKLAGGNLQWRSALTLPISHESNRDDVITRLTGSLMYSKMLLDNKITLLALPFARYHVMEFKTLPSGRGSPWYTLGVSLSAIYSLTPRWFLSGGYSYSFEGRRSSQYDTTPTQLLNGDYSFDLGLSWQFMESLSANLGYSQGLASLMQQGRYEMVFFDDQASRYNFGITYIF